MVVHRTQRDNCQTPARLHGIEPCPEVAKQLTKRTQPTENEWLPWHTSVAVVAVILHPKETATELQPARVESNHAQVAEACGRV